MQIDWTQIPLEERKRLRKEHKFGRKTIRSDGQESATAEEQASDPSMVE